MTIVQNLIPGDVVETPVSRAIFITQSQHPLHPDLQLVVWLLPGGLPSFDALSRWQDVGVAMPSSALARAEVLRRVFSGAGWPL